MEFAEIPREAVPASAHSCAMSGPSPCPSSHPRMLCAQQLWSGLARERAGSPWDPSVLQQIRKMSLCRQRHLSRRLQKLVMPGLSVSGGDGDWQVAAAQAPLCHWAGDMGLCWCRGFLRWRLAQATFHWNAKIKTQNIGVT